MCVLGVAGSFCFDPFGLLDCFGGGAEVFTIRDDGGTGLRTRRRGGKPDDVVGGTPEGVFVPLSYQGLHETWVEAGRWDEGRGIDGGCDCWFVVNRLPSYLSWSSCIIVAEIEPLYPSSHLCLRIPLQCFDSGFLIDV